MYSPDGADVCVEERLPGEVVSPRASSLIESLRSLGYSVETAIADLIDNSISAGADTVWLKVQWNGKGSYIVVQDNGCGMTEEELVEAMRPGSRGLSPQRAAEDLGKFGLGLKTASFSQCRCVTVASRTADSGTHLRCWDLDWVAKHDSWQLLKQPPNSTLAILQGLDSHVTGTAVIWEELDRVLARTGTGADGSVLFLNEMDSVKNYLGMVFHMYLADNSLKIFLNGTPVPAWDPFLAQHDGTQCLPVEQLSLAGARITVSPYILPHESRLSSQEHDAAGGPFGWNAQQGFYVYRDRRMVIPGSWLGIGPRAQKGEYRKEEHYKLARIRLDFPVELDSWWDIDVRKSTVRVPAALRNDLRRIADATRQRAVQVYRLRGATAARRCTPDVFVWEEKRRSGKTLYRINRHYPLVQSLRREGETVARKLNALLSVIEDTLPVAAILIKNAESGEVLTPADENPDEQQLIDAIMLAVEALEGTGLAEEAAWARLKTMEPFNRYQSLVERLYAGNGGRHGGTER